MTVYHWTTKENAEKILKEGLREGSYVCSNPSDWTGEVCLVIESLNIFADPDDIFVPGSTDGIDEVNFIRSKQMGFIISDQWQGTTHRHIDPEEVRTMSLQEQYDILFTKYQALLVLAREGLKSCSTCNGTGEMKWGLVTDAHPEVVPCDTCARSVLKKFLDEDNLGV
jgi:hypothetical protein